MTNDFAVTCGHAEYSTLRFHDDTRHMVILEADCVLPELEQFQYERPACAPDTQQRARLFLTDAGYKTLRKMAAAGQISILHHAQVVGGYLVEDKKAKRKMPKGSHKGENDFD